MIRLRALVLAGLLILPACGTSVTVVGRVDPDDGFYYGTATSDGADGGRIEMTSADGRQCLGRYRFSGGGGGLLAGPPTGGIAHLLCNDGRSAVVRFTNTGLMSGYGFGRADDGSVVRFAFGMTEAEAAPHLGPPVVQAQQPRRTGGSGTGFFVGPTGEFMTNAHVAGNCKAVSARLVDGTVHAARTLGKDVGNDLALLTIDKAPPAVLTFDGTPAYRAGDVAIAYGFPLPQFLTDTGNLTTGHITALSGGGNDSRMLQISTPVQPGNSGGPLVDERGAVLGVVTSKLDALVVAGRTGDVPQNANFAVKEILARSFMQAHGVQPLPAGNANKRSVADIGETLRKASVLVRCEGD